MHSTANENKTLPTINDPAITAGDHVKGKKFRCHDDHSSWDSGKEVGDGKLSSGGCSLFAAKRFSVSGLVGFAAELAMGG